MSNRITMKTRPNMGTKCVQFSVNGKPVFLVDHECMFVTYMFKHCGAVDYDELSEVYDVAITYQICAKHLLKN